MPPLHVGGESQREDENKDADDDDRNCADIVERSCIVMEWQQQPREGRRGG